MLRQINWDLSHTLFARTKAVVLLRFFKSGRLRGVSAKNGIFFLQSFFVFGFAKQMTDVSQARKEGPLMAKKKRYKNF